MSAVFLITSLVVFGLVLLLIEVIFIPGTTIIGIIGAIFCFSGIIYAYYAEGALAGHITLFITLILASAAFWYGLKNDVWLKFALKRNIDSKVGDDEVIPPMGTKGIATSHLRPIGWAEFEGKRMEVISRSGMIEKNMPLVVVKTENRKIFVEQLKL